MDYTDNYVVNDVLSTPDNSLAPLATSASSADSASNLFTTDLSLPTTALYGGAVYSPSDGSTISNATIATPSNPLQTSSGLSTLSNVLNAGTSLATTYLNTSAATAQAKTKLQTAAVTASAQSSMTMFIVIGIAIVAAMMLFKK